MLDSSLVVPEVVEVLPLIPVGAFVRTWDNAIGQVTRSTLAEVDIVFPGRVLGRGPWTYERWQVEVAS